MIRSGPAIRRGSLFLSVCMMALLPTVVEAEEITFEDAAASDVFTKELPTNLKELTQIQDRLKTIAEPLMRCTVGLQIGRAQGSGVIVSEDGLILTAAHVSGKPGQNVTVILHDGSRVRGVTLGRNTAVDAGMIRLTTKRDSWPFASVGDMKDVGVGQWVLALGHPRGYQKGRPPVARIGRVILKRGTVLQTGCTLVGGDSGGPLFDLNGKVIGIHSRIGTTSAWNFHVPASAYSLDWKRLVDSESWAGMPGRKSDTEQALLGVQGADADKGVRVTAVTPAFPAAKAGVKTGDIIRRFDGKAISSFDELYNAVAGKKPDDKVKVEYERDGTLFEVEVTLARRPS